MIAKLEAAENNDMTTSLPLFVYEGKGGNTADLFDGIEEQLSNWLAVAVLITRTNRRAAGAKGSEVQLFRLEDDDFFTVAFNEADCKPCLTGKKGRLEIEEAEGYRLAMACLAFIVNNP